MERLGNTRPTGGLHAGALRAWGMLFVVAGIVSRAILQNQMLGVGLRSMQELMELMQASDTAMIVATIAIVLQATETVAVPIFVFLLFEVISLGTSILCSQYIGAGRRDKVVQVVGISLMFNLLS